jgi:hypothetical protein
MRWVVCLFGIFWSSVGFAQLDIGDKIELPYLPAKKWALCIGASNYDSIGKLDFAAKDSIAFGDTLVKNLGFSRDTVVTLVDREGYAAPNAANVKGTLEKFLNSGTLDNGDLFVIYFSGHGVGLKSGDYWLPTDANPANYEQVGISLQSIFAELSKRNLKNVVVISDACRAGEQNGFGRQLLELGRKTNVAVLLGCEPGKKSYEIPRYGSGAFTYFLNRTIKNKTAVDKTTGALLLSNIGEQVAKNVTAYTAAEYGDSAQKPAINAEKDQDVVLGTYPRLDAEVSGYLTALSDTEREKGVEINYSDIASYYGQNCLENEKVEEAVKFFQVAISLGNISNRTNLNYVRALKTSRREYEAKRFMLGHLQDDPESLVDDFAIITANIGNLEKKRTIQAIWNLYRSEYREALVTTLPSLMNRIGASDEELKLAQQIQLDYGSSSKNGTYGHLLECVKRNEVEKLEDIKKEFLSYEQDDQSFDSLLRVMYRGYLSPTYYGKAKEVVDAALVKFPTNTYWLTRRLIVARLTRDAHLEEYVREMLNKSEHADTLTACALVLGTDCQEFLGDFEQASKRQKPSLESEVAVWTAKVCHDSRAFDEMPDSLLKRAPTKLDAIRTAFDALNQTLGMRVVKVDFDEQTRVRLRSKMTSVLSSYSENFGDNPENYLLFGSLWAQSDDPGGLAIFHICGGWKNIEDTLAYGRSEYITMLYESYIKIGLLKASDEIFEKLEKLGLMSDDVLLRASLEALMMADEKRAEKTLSRIKVERLGQTPKSMYDLARLHQKILKGDKKIFDEFMKKDYEKIIVHPDNLMYWYYIAYVNSGVTTPNELLIQTMMTPHPGYYDVWSLAMTDIMENCRLSTKSADKVIYSGFQNWIVDQPINLRFSKISWNTKPDISDFAGEYRLFGTFRFLGDFLDGTCHFTVDAKGALKGEILLSTKEVLPIEGEVSEYGEVNLKVSFDGKYADSLFKLVPHSVYDNPGEYGLPRLIIRIPLTTPEICEFVIKGKAKDDKSL